MKISNSIIMFYVFFASITCLQNLMGFETNRIQEKIRKITPISDMIPISIKTIYVGDADKPVDKTSATKGMFRKYRYELEFNPKSLLANLFYERWFVSVGLYDSDLNDQKYGYWISDDDALMSKDICLYVFDQKEQYLVWKMGGGHYIKNICEPVDKIVELETRINSDIAPCYVVALFSFSFNSRSHVNDILKDEADNDAKKVRIVSLSKDKDNDFCLKVESPKSKSVFTFVVDKKATNDTLELYNRKNKTELKVPTPGMVQWMCIGFKTPSTAKIKRLPRKWFLPKLGGEDWIHNATFVACDGKNVTLDENGKTLIVELSELPDGAKEYIRLILEAEKPDDSNTPAIQTK